MPLLLIPAAPPRPVTGPDDPIVAATSGPAVLVDADDPGAVLTARPAAYRERGGHWHEVGYEAADHWVAASPDLRTRLLADRGAAVTVDEFKATTGGASASMITNNWIHSGHPRVYRIAGELRDLADVLAAVDPGGDG